MNKIFYDWAVVVVKWSVCRVETLTIQVRIPLTSAVFQQNLCLKRMKINKKIPGLARLKKS